MNIIVTGGLGFIGSHLVERLLSEGHHVYVVDDLSTSPLPFEEMMSEINHPRLTVIKATVQEYCQRSEWEGFEIDQIYHLASPVGPAGILTHAGNIVSQVVRDTYTIMALAEQSGARLLDVSTSEVYGGGVGGLCREDMPRIVQARSSVRLEYAVAKLAAETAIINTCAVSDLDAVIVRPFNVAGRRQSGKGGFVLPRFVRQAQANQRLTVFGDGLQMRAFTHVTDIADGLVKAMELGRSGEVYNLGNPHNLINIRDLAYKVSRLSGSGIIHTDGKKVYGDLYEEAADKFPDSKKALAELNWTPTWGIDEIISDVWDYERKRVAVP